MARPKGSADMLEFRRRRALALLDEGRSLNEVARLLECAPSSVMRWRDRRRRGGVKALKVGASPGRPPKLTKVQRRRLVRLLLRGAMAQGYATELWTTARIAEVIEEQFGVTYHRDHVGRLLHGLGWSSQTPERRAVERDEPAIAHWKKKRWPRVKKTLRGWVPTSSSSTNRGSS
jgi:transposase